MADSPVACIRPTVDRRLHRPGHRRARSSGIDASV